MKQKHIIGMAMTGVLIAVLPANALELGDSMPDGDVTMENVDGSSVTIGDIKGENGTLIIFTCNHCPFVKAWQKEMVAIGSAYQKKGFGVMFINPNDPAVKGDTLEGMRQLSKTEGYEFPYVVDATSDVARHYGAAKTPDVFLFDANGTLVYKGAVSEGGRTPRAGGETYLKNALDHLLAGTPVERPETKAVGCSIKFR
jgi:peroxiredoxin